MMNENDELTEVMARFKESGDSAYFFWRSLRHHFVDHGGVQTKFAELLGIDQSYLSRLIKGERDPKLETKEKIAKALGRTVSGMITEGKTIDRNMAAHARGGGKLSVLRGSGTAREVVSKELALPFIRYADDEDKVWEFGDESPLCFHSLWLRTIGETKALGVYKVPDENMAPEIPKGSLVVVDTTMKRYTTGSVYLLSFIGSFFLARYVESSDGSGRCCLMYANSNVPVAEGYRKEQPSALPSKAADRGVFVSQADGQEMFDTIGKVVLVVHSRA